MSTGTPLEVLLYVNDVARNNQAIYFVLELLWEVEK